MCSSGAGGSHGGPPRRASDWKREIKQKEMCPFASNHASGQLASAKEKVGVQNPIVSFHDCWREGDEMS